MRLGNTYSVNGVKLPRRLEAVETIGVDVLVDGESNLDEKIHNDETLGTDLEGQYLDSVCNE